MARVAIIERLRFGVEDAVNEGQEQLPAQVAVKSQIGVPQDARRAAPAPGHAAQDASRGRHAHRRAHAFARDVADQNPHAVGRERDVVVKIAAQVERRLQPGGYVEALYLRRLVGDHGALDVAGHQDFALKLPLAFDVLGVEPGVDDGDAQVVGDVFEQPSVIFVEGVHAAAFERERADDFILAYERDGDLGALPLIIPFVRDVIVGVARDVADDLRAALADGAPDHAVGDFRATGVFPLRRAVTLLDVPDELFVRLVDQSDEQEFVIAYPVEQRRDVIEQPVEVEDRGDFVSDLDHRPHLARAPAQLVVNAGVFERDRQVGAERAERPLVVAREVVRLQALHCHDADDPVLASERERDGDFGVRATPFRRRDRQIARIARHIADVDCVAFAPGGRGDAAVERDDLVRRDLFRAVPDRLLPHQAAPRLVDQKKAEELVGDHFADATGHVFDQLVEVEDGYEFYAQLIDHAPEALP